MLTEWRERYDAADDGKDRGKRGDPTHHGQGQVRQHLAELGFVVDETVTVVTELGGNLILRVKDSRVALDKSMACRIMI